MSISTHDTITAFTLSIRRDFTKFNRKMLIVVSVVVLAVMAVPSWGASFKRMNDQQFIDMCGDGNIQGVIEAIRAGANVNAKNGKGGTALIIATYNAHTELVNTLIKSRADVNAKEYENGWTALMLAAVMGHTEIVNALLKAGADINAKDNLGRTAFMGAAGNGNTATVNFLIDAGADDLADNDGNTALIHASFRGNAETVNALIDAGSYVKQKDNSGKMALDYARDNPKLIGTDALKRLEELSK